MYGVSLLPTSPSYILKTLQRGSTLKLILSVMRLSQASNFTEIATRPINIDDLAVVIVKCQKLDPDLMICLKIKRSDKANISTFAVTVHCEEYNEKIFCSNQWVEVQVVRKPCDISFTCNPGRCGNTAYLYTIEIDLTMHNETSGALLACSQLYEDTDFTDFQLHTADGTVAVHKVVLSIHSDMLKTMLKRGEWEETAEGRIKMPGVTTQTLRHLKQYMYLGTLPDEGLDALLVLASYYLMDKLMADCIAKLVKSMKPENLDDLIELACQNNVPDLIRAVIFQTPDSVMTGAYRLKIKNNGEIKDEEQQT